MCCECFYTGCPPCDFVQCQEPACDESHRILDPECGCCSVCVKLDGERCGGLTNDVCKPGSICMYRLGLIIGENRTGICEPGMLMYALHPSAPASLFVCASSANRMRLSVKVLCNCLLCGRYVHYLLVIIPFSSFGMSNSGNISPSLPHQMKSYQ